MIHAHICANFPIWQPHTGNGPQTYMNKLWTLTLTCACSATLARMALIGAPAQECHSRNLKVTFSCLLLSSD